MAETLLDNLENLQKAIECVICLGPLKSPVVTRCQHHFCADCIGEAMAGANSVPCPLCKREVTSRSLRPTAAMKKIVAAVLEILEAGKKEIIGTELATIDTSKVKHCLSNTTSTATSSSSAKDKRTGFRTLFQTPKGNKSKKPKNSAKKAGLDLLDVIDQVDKRPMLKTPPFGSSSTSTDSKHVPSVSLKGHPKEKPPNDNSKISEDKAGGDPFDFPITQTQPKTVTKPSKKSVKRRSAPKKVSPNDKSKQDTSVRRSSRRLSKEKFSPPTDKTQVDEQVIKSIEETKNHVLTVEPMKSSKGAQKNLPSSGVAPRTENKCVTRRAPRKSLTKNAASAVDSRGMENDQGTKKNINIDRKENAKPCKGKKTTVEDVLTKNDEESGSTIAKLVEENPKITKRLLYSDTSSSIAAVCEEKVSDCASKDPALPNVEDKVAMWLNGLEQSGIPNEDPKISEVSDTEEVQVPMRESELEEFVSASQCYEQPIKVVKRRKRRIVVDLATSEEASPALQEQQLFKNEKQKRKYTTKKKDTSLPKLENMNSTLDMVDPKITAPSETRALKRGKKKGKQNTNMFDISGLSQGVSPFTTPTEPANDVQKEENTNAVSEDACENSDEINGIKKPKIQGSEKHLGTPNVLDAIVVCSDQITNHGESFQKSNMAADNSENDTTKKQLIPVESQKPSAESAIETHTVKTQTSSPQGPTCQDAVMNVAVDIHHAEDSGESCPTSHNQEKVAQLPQPVSPTIKTGAASHLSEKGLQKTVVDLDDMPIVCVKETQDNASPYYVETPHGSKAAKVLGEAENQKADSQEFQKGKSKSVELGLLDFSEPSQAVDKQSEANIVQSDKILETCRMVLKNLDESKCSDKCDENNNADRVSQITGQTPPRVGRVVEVQKVTASGKVSNTMKDVNLSLNEMVDNTEKSAGEKEQCSSKIVAHPTNVENQHAKSPSLYACVSSDGGHATSHISDFEMNVIENTDAIVSVTKEVAMSTRKALRRRRKSRLTMPAKKPRVRVVDAPKPAKNREAASTSEGDKDNTPEPTSMQTKNSDTSKQDTTPEKSADALSDDLADNSPQKDNGNTESDVSSNNTDTSKAWCTSNGWGGMKLTIRFKHSTKSKSSASGTPAQVHSDVTKDVLDCSQIQLSKCSQESNDVANTTVEKLGDGKVMVCVKDNENNSEVSPESRKLTSQNSTLVIADSVRMVSNAPKLLAKPIKSRTNLNAPKTHSSPSKQSGGKEKKIQTPSKESQRLVHISSSFPMTRAECSVVLDKIDTTKFSPYANHAEISPTPERHDAEVHRKNTLPEEEVVIPNSPLLFAPSQPAEDVPVSDFCNNEQIEDAIPKESSPKDKTPTGSPFSQKDKAEDIDMNVEDSDKASTLFNSEQIRQKTLSLLELVQQFSKNLNAKNGEVAIDDWTKIKEIYTELDTEINSLSPDTASQESDIKCTSKRSKRKLSMSSEDDDEQMGITQIDASHDSEQVDSSLPTILPKPRDISKPTSNKVYNDKESERNMQPLCKRPRLDQVKAIITSTAICSPHHPHEMLDVKQPNTTADMPGMQTLPDIVAAFGDISKVDEINPVQDTEKLLQQDDVEVINESPQSPDFHETSEYEDASEDQNNIAAPAEEDAQFFTACQPVQKPKDSQNELTASQIPSPTPPPPVNQTNVADLTNVTDLLRKISEFTEDLNKEHGEEEKEKDTEDPPMADPSLPPPPRTTIQNAVSEAKDKLSQPTEAREPQTNQRTPGSKTPAGRQILSPLHSSNVSLMSNDTSLNSICGRHIGIMASGMRGKAAEITKRFAKRCRGAFYDFFVAGEVTHVIVKTDQLRCDRTLKFLQGIASKIWVVSYLWVVNSLKQKKVLPEHEFEVVGDSLDVDDQLSLYAPKRSRTSSADYKLLSGYAVCCVPPFALFSADQLREILDLCGATVVKEVEDFRFTDPGLKRILALDANAYSDSLPNYADLAMKHKAEAVSCDWVLECVATFRLHPTNLFPVEDFESQVAE